MLRYEPRFLDMGYHLNGARGAVQLYAEAEKHFVARTGNMTSLYWNTNKEYQATIGITLWITASCELHRQTGKEHFRQNGLSAFRTLQHLGIMQRGQVFDGVVLIFLVSQTHPIGLPGFSLACLSTWCSEVGSRSADPCSLPAFRRAQRRGGAREVVVQRRVGARRSHGAVPVHAGRAVPSPRHKYHDQNSELTEIYLYVCENRPVQLCGGVGTWCWARPWPSRP
eukprot:COSAG01_NODE_3675_length_5804_cov_4.926919_3_plen_225_part_00